LITDLYICNFNCWSGHASSNLDINMSERHRTNAMPARMLSGLTRSASGIRGLGHTDGKWATGTRYSCNRVDNLRMLECYYFSNPSERVYMQRMWDQWILQNPTSNLSKKQLMTQCSNVIKWNLLSQLVIDEVQQRCNGNGEPGRQVRGHTSPSSPPEYGYQAPLDSPDSLNTRAAE